MRHIFQIFIVLAIGISAKAQNPDCSGGWIKHENNPILGGTLGTIFDVSVLKSNAGNYMIYSSWYDGSGIALSKSTDGLKWPKPVICINYADAVGNRMETGYANRPCVIRKDGIYQMWYTFQSPFYSCIEYAESNDGKKWTKKSDKPVLVPGATWEKKAVISPYVIWDEQEKIYKMWYSGGEDREADAIGYATSKDGLNWDKHRNNPVFTANAKNDWEQAKVAGCQVIKRQNDYLIFYTGYKDNDNAQIGMARSKDGISNWERYNANPIIKPGEVWDSYAVYKPCVIADTGNNRWLLYYSGRRGWMEQIGVAIHKDMDLGF